MLSGIFEEKMTFLRAELSEHWRTEQPGYERLGCFLRPDVNKYVWILLDIPVPLKIFKCELFPRNGKRQATQILTHY